MQAGNRVMLNTVVLYLRSIITLVISLWSVPLILKALGTSDYGLYNLIAGVIAMLAFLNAAMTVVTQRYMSVYMGKNDKEAQKKVFTSSVVLHLAIGLFIVILFEICGLFLFDGFLKIEPERVQTAKIVYQFIIVSTFFTIITVPYNAVMNANEDMIAFSVIGIIDSLLKLALAFLLSAITWDRLIIYSLGVCGISLMNVLISRIYVTKKYKDMRFSIKRHYDAGLIKEMFSLSGWSTLGAVAMLGRNQGIAIVINKFFGTVVNAAYGIANQINGVLATFSSVLQQAINPQLMKSAGQENQERMLKISYVSSKMSVLIFSIMAIPLIVEMPYILKLWLGECPESTLGFARLVLINSIVYQYSSGVMSSILAGGKIGSYQSAMSVLILSNIPMSILLLSLGLPAYSVIGGFIIIEIITLSVRLLFAKKLVGFDVKYFLFSVICKTCLVSVLTGIAGIGFCMLVPQQSFFRLIATTVISVTILSLGAWLILLNDYEKSVFKSVVRKVLNHRN